MKRLLTISLAVVFALTAVSMAFAGGQQDAGEEAEGEQLPKITWKLSHTQDPKSTYHLGAMKMKEYVEEQTDGRFVINIHHSGELGWEREVLEAMQVGTIEATTPALGPFATFVKPYDVFNLPFTFQGAEHMLKAYEHPVMDKLKAAAEEEGFVVATHCLPTFRYPLYSGHKITKPSDFKGLKFRTMAVPPHVDTYKALGAQVVTTAFKEVYSALQMGTIDGCENYYQNLLTMNFPEVTKYVSNLPILNNAAAFVFSKKAFDELPAEYQEIVVEGAKLGAEEMNAVAVAQEKEALQTMVEEYGIEKVFVDDFGPFVEKTQLVSEKHLSEMEPWVSEARDTIMSLAK
jgi:TRAP-type transport system periplasmic protein